MSLVTLLPSASQRYIDATHASVFGWNPPTLRPLQNAEGALKRTGENIRIDHSDDSLAVIAEQGVDAFYPGDIARMTEPSSSESSFVTCSSPHVSTNGP